MPQHRPSSFLILTIASLLTLTALAQQNSSPTRQGIIHSVVQGSSPQRIVDECSVDCSSAAPEVAWRTVTFQIPDFKPGEEDTHTYVISNVRGDGSGGGSAKADEFGILQKEEGYLPEQEKDKEATQYYFTAIDVNTLEARVTLDLFEVKLRPFLNSLQNAVNMGTRSATKTRLGIPRSAPAVSGDMVNYRERRLTIRGENLTIAEVLDKLYQSTGCIVDQEPERLVVASCP